MEGCLEAEMGVRVELTEVAPSLHREGGIWTSGVDAEVSYPERGNTACFEVEDRSFWFRHRNDCILAAVRGHPPAGTIVDVGGGNGYVTRRLLDEGFHSILLEPGRDGALNGSRGRNIPDVVCSTLKGARFVPGSVPAIGLFDVLEHIEDDQDFVEQLRAALGFGGTLYGTVPAGPWLWSMSDVDAGHFRRYSGRTIRNLLRNRFDLIYETYFFAPLILPVLAARALPYRLGRRGSPTISEPAAHATEGGPLVRFLKASLAGEVRKIEEAKSSSLGTSLLFVARVR
jgi:hypothetical protein